MEETQKLGAGAITETKGRSVSICLQSSVFVLEGLWEWEMKSEAVYCTDVIAFPSDFEGTKGIIHPDDIAKVSSMVALLEEQKHLT